MSSPSPVVSNNDASVILRNNQPTQSEITTIQKLYTDNGEIELFQIDPRTRRSFINKSAYAKLHRSFSSSNCNRRSVDSLKSKYENTQTNPEIVPENDIKIKIQRQSTTTTQLRNDVVDELKAQLLKKKPAPLPKPRHLLKPKTIEIKDENSNLIIEHNNNGETDDLSEVEERPIIIRPSASEESIVKIAKELSNFTMDRKPKDKKRSSFRRLFSTSLFGTNKDKKKKDEDRNRRRDDNNIVYDGGNYGDRREHLIYNDNLQNETNFNQQIPPQISNGNNYQRINDKVEQQQRQLTQDELANIEKQYAEMHINKFNQIRQNFAETKRDYVPMDKPKKKPSISDYISAPVPRYIDTSSSSSEAEKPNRIRRHNSDIRHDTPPRAQETYQNIKLVKPKASIPINTERSLPNPYQCNDVNHMNPQTIERNLNKSNNKDYPDKKNDINIVKPKLNETYGTVFDSLEYITSKNGEIKPVNSSSMPIPKSPSSSLESSKLKLPPNREIYPLQPRVKSPIPTNRISTDKIIATELLRNSRSPTPQRNGRIMDDVLGKPPISPKIDTLSDRSGGGGRIVTNAMVHTPRSQTPSQIELRHHNNARSPTPNDLRMSASLKLSPQKGDIRKSVEEYYWKELKRMKENEDYSLYMMQLSNGYIDESARVRRSRSLSPSSQKYGRRSLSLPRDVRPATVPVKDYPDSVYGRLPPQSIPEDQALVLDARRKLNYERNFIRDNPERRTIGGSVTTTTNETTLQRPIFRRGSLNKSEIYENQSYNNNKKVSFINNNNNNVEVWPTKNGYTQSPPQRRLDKRESLDDDDVFLPNSPQPPPIHTYGYYNYGQIVQNEPIYGNRGLMMPPPHYDPRIRPSTYRPEQIGPRRLSVDSIARPPPPPLRQEIYMPRNRHQLQQSLMTQHQQQQQQQPRHPSLPMKREIIIQDDIYGEFGGYQTQYSSNSQLSNQRTIANPLYSSKQSIIESNYNNNNSNSNQQQKHVTMNNKYCDIYGQIHDQSTRSGVLMGRLQNPTTAQQQQQQSPKNFVRGTRLTASANDMGRRYYNQQQFDNDTNTNYDTRPLPPIPNNNNKRHPILPTTTTGPLTISDTESGSDASEVRRIMQHQTKITNNKKRGGIFGK